MQSTTALAGLPAGAREALFGDPWACQAVVRSLPDLSRLLVLRLALCEEGVPRGHAETWWVAGGAKGSGVRALEALFDSVALGLNSIQPAGTRSGLGLAAAASMLLTVCLSSVAHTGAPNKTSSRFTSSGRFTRSEV